MGVKHRVLVLGGGLVGRTIAWDLARGGTFDVTVADVRAEVLEAVARDYGVATLHSDLSRPEAVRAAVQGFDLVLGALSSALGWATLRAVIEAGKPYVDISFMAEDPLELDALAKGARRRRPRRLRRRARPVERDGGLRGDAARAL
jgi:lysine 6-dehydrogenase